MPWKCVANQNQSCDLTSYEGSEIANERVVILETVAILGRVLFAQGDKCREFQRPQSFI